MTELYDHVFIRDSDANSMYIPTDPGLGKLTTLSAIVFSSPVFKTLSSISWRFYSGADHPVFMRGSRIFGKFEDAESFHFYFLNKPVTLK